MTDMSDRRIAVVGGGIGGVTTALAFALTGAKVVLFEQAPAFAEVGAGLQVTPNGARVLQALGVSDALERVGLRAEAVVPTDALTGSAIARFDLRDQVPAYRFVHRADLLQLLVDAARAAGVRFHNGARVTEVSVEGDVYLAGPSEAMEVDLVLGADGLHSVCRAAMNHESAPFFTGQVAWRAVVDHKHPPEARIWMAPGRHVVTYPLRHGRTNIVAVEERADWAEEGWHQSDDPSNLRAAFSGCCEALTGILDRAAQVNLWGLFRHPVAEHWHYGRLALLGDAAHPTLPFLAQGANLAMEDGYVLAQSVAAAPDINAGLTAYQSTRRARVVRAIAAANANARNYHLSGSQRWVAHHGLRVMGAIAPGAFLGRYAWIYDYDVTRTAG